MLASNGSDGEKVMVPPPGKVTFGSLEETTPVVADNEPSPTFRSVTSSATVSPESRMPSASQSEVPVSSCAPWKRSSPPTVKLSTVPT